jgi:hypothetical protein
MLCTQQVNPSAEVNTLNALGFGNEMDGLNLVLLPLAVIQIIPDFSINMPQNSVPIHL